MADLISTFIILKEILIILNIPHLCNVFIYILSDTFLVYSQLLGAIIPQNYSTKTDSTNYTYFCFMWTIVSLKNGLISNNC